MAADGNVRARVPGRCLLLRDERFPPGACGANRSRTARSSPQGAGAKGWKANARPKEHKWAVRPDVGGECASKHEAQEPLATFARAQHSALLATALGPSAKVAQTFQSAVSQVFQPATLRNPANHTLPEKGNAGGRAVCRRESRRYSRLKVCATSATPAAPPAHLGAPLPQRRFPLLLWRRGPGRGGRRSQAHATQVHFIPHRCFHSSGPSRLCRRRAGAALWRAAKAESRRSPEEKGLELKSDSGLVSKKWTVKSGYLVNYFWARQLTQPAPTCSVGYD